MSPLTAPPHPLAQASLSLPDASSTAALGCALADALLAQRAHIEVHGFVLWLRGDLGTGKTALVRAALRRLGVEGPVKSPTFTLLEPYVVSSLRFHHFDFYRFSDAAEFDAAGFRESFGAGCVCAVEWPERAQGRLPTADLSIALQVKDDGRVAHCVATSEAGAQCLQAMTISMQQPPPIAAAADC